MLIYRISCFIFYGSTCSCITLSNIWGQSLNISAETVTFNNNYNKYYHNAIRFEFVLFSYRTWIICHILGTANTNVLIKYYIKSSVFSGILKSLVFSTCNMWWVVLSRKWEDNFLNKLTKSVNGCVNILEQGVRDF